MHWVHRGERRYLYQSVRIDGKVKKKYLGTGVDAEVLAKEAESQRREKEASREARLAEAAHYAAAIQRLTNFCEITDLLVRSALLRNGYHQHDRTWRRKKSWMTRNT